MPKSLAKTIILIALMTLVSACGPAATAIPPSATVVSPAPTTAPPTDTIGLPTATTVPFTPTPTSKTGAQGFLLEDVGFRTPESVLYDPKADLYLVANIRGDPSARDGNGFISRISPEGEVIALKWIDGQAEGVTLNAPKGMALTGKRLFVADIDVVRVFDRKNGAPLDEITVQGARFLNDVAADEGGTVYVTDSATGVLHRIRPDGSLEQAGQAENANGIQVHGGTILVTGGSDQIFRLDDDGALNPEYETPGGGLDGLVVDDSEPPFLLIHGLDDSTIEPEQSIYLAETLERAGVEVELLPLPDADHGAIINSEQSLEAVENFLATLAQASTQPPMGCHKQGANHVYS